MGLAGTVLPSAFVLATFFVPGFSSVFLLKAALERDISVLNDRRCCETLLLLLWQMPFGLGFEFFLSFAEPHSVRINVQQCSLWD